ncbi:uncharacterized protein LOC131016546 [Salvia miltiorrhiza]|uniref:uncharacterized protein LOC131016546 n=1 Tax=Salvia miltiorrhiza TaxID=226208 RepID=UPI0025AC5139|nr:uncharacterized protein LOC131016546 [Salvia miltiorrhiza]
MPESRQTSSTKCFSAVLSRLLCSGGLPTHPSEQLIEPSVEKFEFPKPQENAKRSSSPGVVARLMGLESFPAENHNKERTLGDFFRSRSVNSIDFLSHFDPRKHQHRRVRTSVSFREGVSDDFASVFLLLEEEFQAKINEDMRGNRVSNEKNVEIQEKRKSVYGKNVEIKEKKGSVSSKKKGDLEGKRRADLKERRTLTKGVKCEEELKKKKKKKSKILGHNKLNFDFKKIHPQGAATEVARVGSPRKHQPSPTASSQSQSSSSNTSFSDNVEVRAIITEKNEGKIEMNDDFFYKKMVEEICMLTEESARENWIYGMELNFENLEEMCRQFGQEILEILLAQFVDELVLYFGKRN